MDLRKLRLKCSGLETDKILYQKRLEKAEQRQKLLQDQRDCALLEKDEYNSLAQATLEREKLLEEKLGEETYLLGLIDKLRQDNPSRDAGEANNEDLMDLGGG